VINADAVAAISAIEDPAERHAGFLGAMNDARELQADLARRRGLTVYELYHLHGARKAARLLGISRASLYRIIAEHAPPEVKQARNEAALMTVGIVAAALAEAQNASTSAGSESLPIRTSGPLPPESLKGGT